MKVSHEHSAKMKRNIDGRENYHECCRRYPRVDHKLHMRRKLALDARSCLVRFNMPSAKGPSKRRYMKTLLRFMDIHGWFIGVTFKDLFDELCQISANKTLLEQIDLWDHLEEDIDWNVQGVDFSATVAFFRKNNYHIQYPRYFATLIYAVNANDPLIVVGCER